MKKENKALFYILSFTWGLPFVLVGLLVLAFIRIFLHKKIFDYKVIAGRICIIWNSTLPGAINLGIVYILDKDSMFSVRLHKHEIGHSIQNAFLGPLFIPVIGIPSLIRASVWDKYSFKIYKKTGKFPDYDGIWFEGQATKLGATYVENEITEDINKRIKLEK